MIPTKAKNIVTAIVVQKLFEWFLAVPQNLSKTGRFKYYRIVNENTCYGPGRFGLCPGRDENTTWTAQINDDGEAMLLTRKFS
jgi:hypothetical protein